MRAPAVNQRMRVGARVRLPGGDVDMDTSIPIRHTMRARRNPRIQGRAGDRNAVQPHNDVVRQNTNTSGITVRSLCVMTSVLALVLGMLLLLQLSDMMEKSKEVNAIQTSITQTKAQNEQLKVDLAKATRETDVAYSASQRLGLIAGKGADSVYIQVPDKYAQTQITIDQDAPPVQNGAYAALSGLME